eukprot:TRINITY_DN112_c0_g2_i1.p1 TRINITY_DN112_c0_g2~~TRINITY_DN112_c0_g2_i1.p1  ORF type:complete len:153 (-),score=24.46 TRINITY_DN112_c0_g2_i1:92-550(-)
MSTSGPRYTRRLLKELSDMQKKPTPGIELLETHDMKRWKIVIIGAPGSLYHGERFILQFTFSDGYPLDAPEVIFVQSIPKHEHIYGNGHICLSILYDDWSPALSVNAVCLSILSMLSSATKKESPPDNDMYVMNSRGRSPKESRWWFHDDKA